MWRQNVKARRVSCGVNSDQSGSVIGTSERSGAVIGVLIRTWHASAGRRMPG